MNRAEPLSLAEKIMAQHSERHAPNGIYTLTTDIPEVGIRDYECRIVWELRGGRFCVDAIDFDGEDGAQGMDPNGSAMERVMYPRLAFIAMSQSEDILEAYYQSL